MTQPIFITWFAVHCFSGMHCTQCIVQYNALWKAVVCDHPHVLVSTVNRYFVIRGNEIRHILLKQFNLITLDMNTIKYPCISHCT